MISLLYLSPSKTLRNEGRALRKGGKGVGGGHHGGSSGLRWLAGINASSSQSNPYCKSTDAAQARV